MVPPDIPVLTPVDVSTLRASIRWRGTVGANVHTSQIVWIASDETFGLISDGRIMATSADVRILAACLIAERAEPGYIRRIIDSTEPPDVATLDPAARLAAKRRSDANAARIRELNRQSAEAARQRRIGAWRGEIDPTTVDLDDIL